MNIFEVLSCNKTSLVQSLAYEYYTKPNVCYSVDIEFFIYALPSLESVFEMCEVIRYTNCNIFPTTTILTGSP